jgi:hypothetical protein
MRRIPLLLMLWLGAYIAYGQDGAIHTKIAGTVTGSHVNIPGTRMYVILPPDFFAATDFLGFQKNDSVVISVLDILGDNYNTIADSFLVADPSTGDKIVAREDIIVAGYPGKLTEVLQHQSLRMYRLAFGDTSFCAVVTAVYPAGDASTGKELVAAINSLAYDKQVKIDPFAIAHFTLDDQVSAFKFCKFWNNTYTYTIGGKEIHDADTAALYVLQQVNVYNMTPKDFAQQIMQVLMQNGMDSLDVQNASTTFVNRLPAYELAAKCKLHGQPTMFYLCVAADMTRVYCMYGFGGNAPEVNMAEMMRLAHTIKVK